MSNRTYPDKTWILPAVIRSIWFAIGLWVGYLIWGG